MLQIVGFFTTSPIETHVISYECCNIRASLRRRSLLTEDITRNIGKVVKIDRENQAFAFYKVKHFEIKSLEIKTFEIMSFKTKSYDSL